MNRILCFLFVICGILTVNSQITVPDGLESETVSNLVATVKSRATAYNPKVDEMEIASVTGKIRRFIGDISSCASQLDNTKKEEIACALVAIMKALREVEDKIDTTVEYNQMRTRSLPSLSEYPKEVLGMDGREVRGMLVQQFSRNLDGLASVSQHIRNMEKRIKDITKTLAANTAK